MIVCLAVQFVLIASFIYLQKRKKMKKKLIIVIQLLRRGGVEIVALNFALSLNPDKYDITFCLINPSEGRDEELYSLLSDKGIKIIEVPENVNGYLKKYLYIKHVLKSGKYDIVHSHVMFFSGIVLCAAKKAGVKIRIAHSHATKWNRKENLIFKIYKLFMRTLISFSATRCLYCSKDAGIYLYGKSLCEKRGAFVANGIYCDKYKFNSSSRESVRYELSIPQSSTVVGHIGTIYYIKNQSFLIDVFSEFLKFNNNSFLLLVGEETDRKAVEKKAKSLKVSERVIFAGMRSDIPDILSAMDIMIFPSLFEALPVSLIEAQASQLPCLISDRVTREVAFNRNVDFMSLDESPKKWAEKAIQLMKFDRKNISIHELSEVYSLEKVSENLDKIYNS